VFSGKNFYNKIGTPFCSAIRQDMATLIQNDQNIRLENIGFGEVNIEGRVVKHADRVLLQIFHEQKLQVSGYLLMDTVRSRSYIKISINQLMSRTRFRQILVVFYL